MSGTVPPADPSIRMQKGKRWRSQASFVYICSSTAHLEFPIPCTIWDSVVLCLFFLIGPMAHYGLIYLFVRLVNPVLTWFSYPFLPVRNSISRIRLERYLPKRVITVRSQDMSHEVGFPFGMKLAESLNSSIVMCARIYKSRSLLIHFSIYACSIDARGAQT